MRNLDKHRAQIDKIDKRILDLIEKRHQISREIGKIKKKQQILVYDRKRENQVLNKRLEIGENKGFSKTFITTLFKTIFKDSRRVQKDAYGR